jgi:regulator of RNase E activity RraA
MHLQEKISRPPKNLVEQFWKTKVSTVHDVLDSMGIRGSTGGFTAISASTRIVGTAVTLRHIVSQDKTKNRARHDDLREIAEPGDVCVIDAAGRLDCGTWGAHGSHKAKAKGLAGAIIDGAIRDVEDIRQTGFPILYRHASPFHVRGDFESVCMNHPIQIGPSGYEVQVRPGDIILGDIDGIAVVPKEKAVEVLKLALKKEDLDAKVMKDVEEGKSWDEIESGPVAEGRRLIGGPPRA